MRWSSLIRTAALLTLGCGGGPASPVEPSRSFTPTVSTPFDLVGQGWMRFDVHVFGMNERVSTRMMFDTGGGVTLFSKKLCDRVGCVPDGTFTGKRMSGQDITLPMARVASVEIAGHRISNVRVAVLDTTALLPPELGIDGAAALDLFRDRPFTIDYANKRFIVEDEASLAARRSAGDAVTVRIENDGPSTVLYLPLELSNGTKPLEMEVDTGSLHLILDDHYMDRLALDPKDVERVDGKDQTSQAYVRSYAHLPKAAHVSGTKDVVVPAGATVMFQSIIHDGLVGHQFLSAHTTTFDISHATLIFAHTQ